MKIHAAVLVDTGDGGKGMVRDVVVAKELAVHAAMWGIQKQGIMGIPGDEDGGGMTAFVVFSSIGLYPVTPGLPEYSIGSPLFEKSQISLGNGKTFTVVARGVSEKAKYIQSATLNGKKLERPFLSHEDVAAGGTLCLVMGEKPNFAWGAR